jgi:hypothetical protein
MKTVRTVVSPTLPLFVCGTDIQIDVMVTGRQLTGAFGSLDSIDQIQPASSSLEYEDRVAAQIRLMPASTSDLGAVIPFA